MAPKLASEQLPAECAASDWNRLVVLSTLIDDLFLVKCVCVDESPHQTNRVTLFCMTSDGTPLAEGVFKTEEGFERCFAPFDANDTHHRVMDMVFQDDNDNSIEGVILSIRDPDQMISNSNLRNARGQQG